jgi:hypothetical protein
MNEDGGVNGADVVSPAGGHRSVGGITEGDGIDLGWIVFVVSRGGSGCGAGGGEMCMSGVTKGIEDRGERNNGGNDSEQDGSGAEWLAAGDIEAGSGERRDAGEEGLLHDGPRVFRGAAGSEEVRRGWPPLVV